MHPILFHLAGRPIESDGALYFVAAVVAGVFASRVARHRGWNPADVLPGLVLTILAALLGALLLGAMTPWEGFATNPLGALRRSGGLSFFGGLALGALALLGYVRWKGYPVGEVADALAPVAPVLYGLFRLGCLLNGDDYGPPTALPWGMRFPAGSPPTSAAVHPTPLYEMLLMVPVFAWMQTRKPVGRPPGSLTFELCLLMGAERFLIEFWRIGSMGPAGLTVSQWFALGLIAIGLLGRWRLRGAN
ncbi:MAG: prolipoprotein diacylglyceryl transferase [Gemmatimonadota bacterium]